MNNGNALVAAVNDEYDSEAGSYDEIDEIPNEEYGDSETGCDFEREESEEEYVNEEDEGVRNSEDDKQNMDEGANTDARSPGIFLIQKLENLNLTINNYFSFK
ncbi:hypothetical protein [Parasitella parasitica]|uniref:Uncharacterized protein n=1 Tax=Parasitella parasitica TaxID=35722 RepID=A0A0B7NJ06_9FUNG|nr:hypothetical protein [Parasitella parasitica]